jgi:glutamate-1-semialdehyde 2,1-aminomutase
MAPEGNIYQAGTLSGNPLAMAAGIATLKALQEGQIYRELEEKAEYLFGGLKKAAEAAGVEVTVNRIASMGSVFFSSEAVTDFASAKKSNGDRFRGFYGRMLEQGIYLAPSPFEAWFVSAAHGEESLQKTIACAARAFEVI